MRTAKTTLIATIALVVAACGSDAGGTITTVEPTSTSSSAPATTTTSTTAAPSTTAASSTTTTAPPPTTSSTLAGSPIDFGPAAGDVMMVVRVAYDDVLNLRAGPGTNAEILDGIPPTYDELVALGNTRELPGSFWIEVHYEGNRGWVHMAFVAFIGDVADETSTVIDEVGERPVEPTMTDLGQTVADVFDSEEEPQSDVIQVTEIVDGDLTEVTYDVVGLGDDAVLGFRLHIFAEESSAGFTLRSVEATLLCLRAVSDGLCV